MTDGDDQLLLPFQSWRGMLQKAISQMTMLSQYEKYVDGWLPGTAVVPTDNPNHHTYPIGVTVIVAAYSVRYATRGEYRYILHDGGFFINESDSLELGNHLPNPGTPSVRYATAGEIDQFCSQIKPKSLIESNLVNSLLFDRELFARQIAGEEPSLKSLDYLITTSSLDLNRYINLVEEGRRIFPEKAELWRME